MLHSKLFKFKNKFFTMGKAEDSENYSFTPTNNGNFKVNFWGYISYGKFEIYRTDGNFNRSPFIQTLQEQNALGLILETRNSEYPIE
jgi:hypothetical protein